MAVQVLVGESSCDLNVSICKTQCTINTVWVLVSRVW